MLCIVACNKSLFSKNVTISKPQYTIIALNRLKLCAYFLSGDDVSFLRKRLPNRWKVPDFDGEKKSAFSSFFVGVRGSIIGFGSGSGLGFLIALPHLSHLSALKIEKNIFL